MVYGISILAAVIGIILWPKAARRIFCAWLVFFVSLSAWDYKRVSDLQATIRADVRMTTSELRWLDLLGPTREAFVAAVEKRIEAYPGHWWETAGSTRQELSLGFHNQVLLRMQEQAAAREGDVKSARAAAPRRRSAEIRPSLISVVSDPPGAKVRMDGYLCGETPVDVEVGAGRTALLVSKDGYSDFVESVTVAKGKSVTVRIQFSRFPGRTAGVVFNDPE